MLGPARKKMLGDGRRCLRTARAALERRAVRGRRDHHAARQDAGFEEIVHFTAALADEAHDPRRRPALWATICRKEHGLADAGAGKKCRRVVRARA